ncbi:unnamed protein product, partial [Ixodes hexagonus]
RTYETLAHNAAGEPTSTLAATDYEQEDNDRLEVAQKDQAEDVPMKEASTSTTEDKATTTTAPQEDDAQPLENSTEPKVPDKPARTESQPENVAATVQLQTDQSMTNTEEKIDGSKDVHQEERTSLHSRASNRTVEPMQVTTDNTEAPSESNALVNQNENIETSLQDESAEDGLEIAYAAPIDDEKRLQELAEHLHYLSHSANHSNNVSRLEKRPRTEGDDDVSMASLNSFYEKEQALQQAEKAASDKKSASQQSRKRDSFSAPQEEQWDFDRDIKEDAETGEPLTNSETLAVVPVESRHSGLSRGRRSSEDTSRNQSVSYRKSSDIIHSDRSIGTEPRPASNQDTTTPQNNEPVKRDEARKERRASDASLASLTRHREASEASDRASSHSRRLSLQEAVGSRTSDRRSSKDDDRASTRSVRERSSQGRIPNGGIPEKALPRNVAPSGSSSAAKKSVDESRVVSQTKASRRGPDKKAVGAKSSKRSTDEENGNRGWSRASSVDSLKSNKDSGYSPASVRSKDSSETPQRQKGDEKTSQAQAAARVPSKDFQEGLESYSVSPPHSPIRTYAYLLQPKPVEPSYEFRISESGRVGQATYSAAPPRYSSTVRNQWKPDTYPILEEEDVFYAKPSRGRKVEAQYKEVDLDEDSGGVFRARQRASELGVAVEVQDSNDTKVDVPIDDMEALEVEVRT